MIDAPLPVRLRQGAGVVWEWFFPPACMACHVPLRPEAGDFLCTECRGELRVIVPADCPRCSLGNYEETSEQPCEFCRRLPDSFRSARAAFPYAGVAGDLIRNMKYRHAEHVGSALARLTVAAMAEHFDILVRDRGVDFIVPVPMFYRRRWGRGYNQAESIARGLQDVLRLPCRPDLLVRHKPTPPQARQQSKEARLSNVRGAFEVPEPAELRGKRILLVDDVMTTGATVSSCAEVLMDAGTEEVHIVTVARAGSARIVAADPEMTGRE
ncbi:ComF family protein [bacterium]|nr:ComF family protein [bacterium]